MWLILTCLSSWKSTSHPATCLSDCSHLAVTQAFTGNLGRDGNWVGMGEEDSLFDQAFLAGI